MDSKLRELLRRYLQTRDHATFLTLVSHANRSGSEAMHEIELQLCRADLQDLEQVLLQQFGSGRIHHISIAAPPYRFNNTHCGFVFQKTIQIYHQTTIDWEINFGISYEKVVGLPPQEILREYPLIVLYCKQYPSELVGRVYRVIKKFFPHYAVEISSDYPLGHEAINGCHACGRFPKVMDSDYCIFHDNLRKTIEQRQSDLRCNPASLVKYLTAKEFLDEMNYQDLTGKHRTVQPYWQRIADYAVKQSPDPNKPFILVQDLPLNNLSSEHAPEERELIEEYSQRSTDFPPIYVSLTDYQLSQDPAAQPKVKNGNHRVVAAQRRGNTVIDAIMTQETWRNIQKLGLRKNPDEQFRNIERQLRLHDTFENRVQLLRMRLRIGDISADRVEAAAEIGSLEAQEIYKPTGVVGMDWAISTLADHLPLKPIMEKIVLHSLASYDNVEERAKRYIVGTFTNPKFDFSSQLDRFFTAGNIIRLARPGDFIEATVSHIKQLLRAGIADFARYDQAHYLATAIRNVWFLSNIVESHQRGTAIEVAYSASNLAINGSASMAEIEAEWQRQFIVECLLR